MRRVGVVLASMTLGALTGLTATAVAQGTAMPNGPHGSYQVCQYEDSNNCVWDAQHDGNGQGQSFVATRKGKVIYVPHRVAHLLQFHP